jgi:tellurite resistance protein TerC
LTQQQSKEIDPVDVSITMWGLTLTIITVLIVVDLVLHRKPQAESLRQSAWATVVWTLLGLAFGLVVWADYGSTAGGEYLAGYLLERTLSLDNVFVFVVILSFFAVPPALQHRALLWGILVALVLRAAFIAVGATLLETFHWMIYLFGAFLVYTAYKLLRQDDEEEVHPEHNPALKLLRRIAPVGNEYHGNRLSTKIDGKRILTPMFAVFVVLGTTDLLFALDSIPAIFAVTDETFIVFASNAFAVLGLRAMAVLLAGVVDRFIYLKHALAVVLALVGAKMLTSEVFHVSTWITLPVIAAILVGGIGLSLLKTRGMTHGELQGTHPPDPHHLAD